MNIVDRAMRWLGRVSDAVDHRGDHNREMEELREANERLRSLEIQVDRQSNEDRRAQAEYNARRRNRPGDIQ
jgi:hypothetical protein